MHHVAQLNIAHLVDNLDSPRLKPFVDSLDWINSLAESSEGFVWRLKDEYGNATSLDYFGPEIIPNLSVWRDTDSLYDFVYRSAHLDILKKRKDWFHPIKQAHQVLWWIPEYSMPTLEEAADRLELLRQSGPVARAFTMKRRFDPAGNPVC
ncbi:MAG: DUF3291 domain-containing protein [Pseudomonadota bacterium]